jgi:hypothetical protein
VDSVDASTMVSQSSTMGGCVVVGGFASIVVGGFASIVVGGSFRVGRRRWFRIDRRRWRMLLCLLACLGSDP